VIGTIIYIIIQVSLLAFAIHIVRNWREIRQRHAHKKDSRWEKVAILVLVPAMAFGYMSLRGFPPKNDQIVWAIVFAIFMYGVVIARWIRQSRIPNQPEVAVSVPVSKNYLYRSSDGLAICGPFAEDRLRTMFRMGFVGPDTLIAEENAPENWIPLGDCPVYKNLCEDYEKLS
jgi:hypothetical protein